jgi:hypothetical protein
VEFGPKVGGTKQDLIRIGRASKRHLPDENLIEWDFKDFSKRGQSNSEDDSID